MASYFDELNIKPDNRQTTRRDANLDDFMSMTESRQNDMNMGSNPFSRVTTMLLQVQQQMQSRGDQEQTEFLDNLVAQVMEESQNDANKPTPASRRFVSSLPAIRKKSLDSELSCVICKDVLATSECKVTLMPCGHYFDQDCLVPWLELHHTCPLCRFEVETEEQAKQKEKEEAEDMMYG